MIAWGLVALAVAMVAGTVWAVAFSSVFDLRRVVVNGNELVAGARIIEVANAPIGEPMVQLDTEAIAGRVSAIPAVASATVSTRWPHSIVVEVTERDLAVQRPQAGRWQWVDPSGLIFHETTARQDGVVVVRTPTMQSRFLADGVAVAAALTPELAARLQHIRVDAPDRITLVLDDGRSVVWGSVDDSPTKAQVATALLAVEGATILDVSSPARPTSR